MSALGSKVGKAGALMVAGRFLARILGVLSTLVIARLLTPDDFAFVALAMAIIAIVQGVTGVQFDKALVQNQQADEADWATAWTLNLIRGVGLTVTVALIGPHIFNALGYSQYVDAILWLSLVPLAISLRNPKFTVFFRDVDMRFEVAAALIQKLSTVLLTIWLAFEWRTYNALLAGVILGHTLETLVTYILMPYRPRLTFEKTRKLWSFSGWMMGSSVFNVIGHNLDHFLIAATLNAKTLGSYRVAIDLVRTPLTDFAGPLTQSLFPAFAKIQDDPERLKSAFKRSLGVLMALMLPVTCGLALVAVDIVPLLLGPSWAQTVPVIQIMAPIEIVSLFALSVESLLLATANTKTLFKRSVLFNVVRIPLLFAGLHYAGITGILVAHGVSNLFQAWLNIQVTRRHAAFGLTDFLSATYRTWVSAGLMVIAVLALQAFLPMEGLAGVEPDYLRLTLSVGLGAATYISSHLALWRLAGLPDTSAEKEVLILLSPLLSRLGLSS